MAVISWCLNKFYLYNTKKVIFSFTCWVITRRSFSSVKFEGCSSQIKMNGLVVLFVRMQEPKFIPDHSPPAKQLRLIVTISLKETKMEHEENRNSNMYLSLIAKSIFSIEVTWQYLNLESMLLQRVEMMSPSKAGPHTTPA